MIKLSKRLETVANMLTPTENIADIGCDHAHTSIYLIQNSIAKKVIAMDVNRGPLERAKENIKLYGCNNKIDIRLSDGAKKLTDNEVNSILISGMGGRLIIKILSDSHDIISNCEELVLQPQSEIFLVRQYLLDIGFNIVKEDMVIDDNKYYVIIKAVNEYNELAQKKNNKLNFNEDITDISFVSAEDMYGKYLLNNKNLVLFQYLNYELKVCNNILSNLYDKVEENNDSEKILNRIEELKQKEMCIRKGLEYYEM